jgi:putative transposase
MYRMNSKHYDSDLTDTELAILEPLLPARKAKGRPRSVALREILDAIFYVLRGGVPWRMLPDGFPCWKAAFHHFRRWRLSGPWEAINAARRERVREGVGRTAQPSAPIIDSQSVETTGTGGPRGYDGGEKANGRERHLAVDTQGLLLKAKVLPADLHDRPAAEPVLAGPHRHFPGVRLVRADTAYRGPGRLARRDPGQVLGDHAPLVDRHAGVGRRRPAAGAPGRVPGAAAPAGGGAELRVAGPQPPAVGGLRAAVRGDRDLDLPCHDPADVAETGRSVNTSILRQALRRR